VTALTTPKGVKYGDPLTLYGANSWDMQLAATAKLLPRKLGFTRCPSDPFEIDNPRYANYFGSQGPQCNDGPCNPRADPFQLHCNAKVGAGGQPEFLPKEALIIHPGYGPSPSWGSTIDTGKCRGMFCRGPNVFVADPAVGLKYAVGGP